MRYLLAVLIVALMPLPGIAQPGAQPAQPAARVFGIDLSPGLDASSAAREGVKWIRATVDWSAVEPAAGKLSWKDLDATVEQATGAGLHVVLVLANTPKWAALDPNAPESVWKHQPPRNLADWQRFVAAAAGRYRGRVAAWQIEPALDLVWFRGTVRDYLGMLHAARLTIRQADPHALVVAASPPGLDLSYIKSVLARPAEDFDALMLFPKGRTPEEVLEALMAVRTRIATDPRHQLWLAGTDAGGPGSAADDAVGDVMSRMAAVAVAGGIARAFWSGREVAPRWVAVRQSIVKLLDGARALGWLPRGPWVYAFIMANGETTFAVVWSAAPPVEADKEPRLVPMAADGGLTIISDAGTPLPAVSTRDGTPAVPAGRAPVFVQRLAPSVLAEAAQTAQQGPFRIPRDAAHDFSHAASVSVLLGATNTEHGLYNQRFRLLPPGAVVPITVDGVDAVRTDQARDAVYVYLDVDHSYAYFLDGRQDVLITVEVHRAKAAQQVGFNILYDSTTGYRFTAWQWIEPGTGWVTYTVHLTDAGFSSAWGWDFAINGAGNKKEPLTVRSVTVRTQTQ
jgi:hypothetical protein